MKKHSYELCQGESKAEIRPNVRRNKNLLSKSLHELRYRPANDNILAPNSPVQANVIDDNISIDPADDNNDVNDFVNQKEP